MKDTIKDAMLGCLLGLVMWNVGLYLYASHQAQRAAEADLVKKAAGAVIKELAPKIEANATAIGTLTRAVGKAKDGE